MPKPIILERKGRVTPFAFSKCDEVCNHVAYVLRNGVRRNRRAEPKDRFRRMKSLGFAQRSGGIAFKELGFHIEYLAFSNLG
jgi:hypothetical protein